MIHHHKCSGVRFGKGRCRGLFFRLMAQSAGALECTDSISAEE